MRANDPWSEMLSHYDLHTMRRLQADAHFWGAGDVERAVKDELRRRAMVDAVATPAAGVSRSYLERVMARAAEIAANGASLIDAVRAARSEVQP